MVLMGTNSRGAVKKSPSRKTTREPAPPPQAAAPLRERILDTAFALFLERGYSGASTLEIAPRARVSKRELYSHFESKQALLAAGIKKHTERMQIPLNVSDITKHENQTNTKQTKGVSSLVGITDGYVL